MSLFLDALNHKSTPRAPFWFMRQAGRYLPEYREVRATCRDFLEFCYTPKKATEVTLQPIRRFGMDAAIIFSDILVIPDAMGQPVRFEPNHGPKLDAITDPDTFIPKPTEKILTHLSPVFDAIADTRAQLPNETALIGFAGSPWTIACYMIQGEGSKEFEKPRMLAYKNPESFQRLMDHIVAATTAYLSRQIEAGAQAIQLFDSWSGVLPEQQFTRWVIEPTKKIVSELKKNHPGIPVIGFPRGAGAKIKNYVSHTGIDAVSFDTSMDTAFIQKEIQTQTTVQGNLDPILLMTDADATLRESERILSLFGKKHFVFNLGHGILPQTPVEHVARLCERLKR